MWPRDGNGTLPAALDPVGGGKGFYTIFCSAPQFLIVQLGLQRLAIGELDPIGGEVLAPHLANGLVDLGPGKARILLPWVHPLMQR